MANKYANLIGTNLIKDEYTKINTGFDGVEADMEAVESAIENHETAADPHDQYALDTDLATLQTEVTAHKADNVSDADGAHGLKVESGTWTPTLAGSTTVGTNSYDSGTSGRYIKIGKLVQISGLIRLGAKTVPMAGTVRIAGLPFVPTVFGGATIGQSNRAKITQLKIDNNQNYMLLIKGYDTTPTVMYTQPDDILVDAWLQFTATYLTN